VLCPRRKVEGLGVVVVVGRAGVGEVVLMVGCRYVAGCHGVVAVTEHLAL
jgi:hypothetical protein